MEGLEGETGDVISLTQSLMKPRWMGEQKACQRYPTLSWKIPQMLRLVQKTLQCVLLYISTVQ